MTRAIALLLVLAVAAPALAGPLSPETPEWPTPEATWKKADWDAFSQNLVVGLATENDGLRASALQMIIRYGDNLDVRDATFDVVEIYRSHPNERMRRLAAVTCLHLKNEWAMSFLRMSEPFEGSDTVLHTVRALLAEHDARKQARVEVGSLGMIADETER
ncbi:MAG: hypothetical protein ABJF88_13030 [Rhodothermales bacterium]